MRHRFAGLMAMAFLFSCTGCDQLEQNASPKKAQPEQQRITHHFEPVAKSNGNLAVDTATGRMCKTWDWECTNRDFKNPYTGKWQEAQSYGMACSAIDTMPTCEQLTQGEPASTQPNSSP